MGTYRVTGGHPVAGVDPGGMVELDPELYHIGGLIEAGHIEPVPDPGPEPETPPATRPARRRRDQVTPDAEEEEVTPGE